MSNENASVVVEVCFLVDGGLAAILYYTFTVCVTGPVMVCGVVGNLVALLVLRAEREGDRRGTSCMTVLLIALALGNLTMVSFALGTFLPSELYCFAQLKFLERFVLQLVNVNWLLYAVDDAVHLFLIYTVLGVAVERWLAAYLPIQRRSSMFTCGRILRYLLAVLVCSVLFQIPRNLEHTVQNVIETIQNSAFVWPLDANATDENDNSTASQSQDDSDSDSDAQGAAIRKVLDQELPFSVETVTQAVRHPFFVTYRIVHTLVEQVTPMLLATLVHARLMLSLKKAQQCRTFLIRLNSGNMDSLAPRKRPFSCIDKSAQLAFVTVSLFIVCESPLCISKLLEVALYLRGQQQLLDDTATWMSALHGVAHSIIHLQASLNLLLYCWNSTKFRSSFRKMFRGGRARFNTFSVHHFEQVVAYENNLRSPLAMRRFDKLPVSRRISNQ